MRTEEEIQKRIQEIKKYLNETPPTAVMDYLILQAELKILQWVLGEE